MTRKAPRTINGIVINKKSTSKTTKMKGHPGLGGMTFIDEIIYKYESQASIGH